MQALFLKLFTEARTLSYFEFDLLLESEFQG